jgi:hydrogenase maturation protease
MDEAIAIILANDLKRLLPDFELHILPVAGIEIIELITGFNIVVIIDTLLSTEIEPGELVFFNDLNTVSTLHFQNPHDVSFYDSIKLAEKLGYSLPDKIIVLGIQIKRNYIASDVLSSEIYGKYNRLIVQAREVIQQQLDF